MKAILFIKQKPKIFCFFLIVCELQQLILADIESRLHNGKDEPIIQMESLARILTSEGRNLGSSVIIGENLILSATHVFEHLKNRGNIDHYVADTICNGEIKRFKLDTSTLVVQRYPDGTVTHLDKEDIAVIRSIESFTQCSENKIAKVSCEKAENGSKIYVAGYGKNELNVTGTLKYNEEILVYMFEFYSYDVYYPNPRWCDKGDSGGPIFNENWEVIGVQHGWAETSDIVNGKFAITERKCLFVPLFSFINDLFLG